MMSEKPNEDISETISYLSGITLEQEMLFQGFGYYYQKKSLNNTMHNLLSEKVKEPNEVIEEKGNETETRIKVNGESNNKEMMLSIKEKLEMDNEVINDNERTETIHYSCSFDIGNNNNNGNEDKKLNIIKDSNIKHSLNQMQDKREKGNKLQKLFKLIHKHWSKFNYPYSKELALKIIQLKNCKEASIRRFLHSKKRKVFFKTHYGY